MKGPFVLIIRDGFGVARPADDNAVILAKTPTEDMLESQYPKCLLGASGKWVGLPPKTIGTSEVGHSVIGAGRIIDSDFVRIDKSIRNGSFFRNKALQMSFRHARQSNGVFHIIGLLSTGGVHSHVRHMLALIKAANKAKVPCVVHVFTDGRDMPPMSAHKLMVQLEKYIDGKNVSIGTVVGRYYAMDRDNRWDRTKVAYDALVHGFGILSHDPWHDIEVQYDKGKTDEFLDPIVTGAPRIRRDDSVVFVNFRLDRARQLTRAFTQEHFDKFPRGGFVDPYFVMMTEYDPSFNLPVMFPPLDLKDTLGEYLAEKGYSQFRIAETEKYAHVTYFFNGLQDVVFKREDRLLIPSPKVATYDKSPAMSARKITSELIKALREGRHDFFVVNFANADMVGHTGKLKETIKAIEVMDECEGHVLEEVKRLGGTAVLTADHGNAEVMFDDDISQPHTAHTLSKVRLFIYTQDPRLKKKHPRNGGLADVAPTILKLMGLEKPKEMKGKALL